MQPCRPSKRPSIVALRSIPKCHASTGHARTKALHSARQNSNLPIGGVVGVQSIHISIFPKYLSPNRTGFTTLWSACAQFNLPNRDFKAKTSLYPDHKGIVWILRKSVVLFEISWSRAYRRLCRPKSHYRHRIAANLFVFSRLSARSNPRRCYRHTP